MEGLHRAGRDRQRWAEAQRGAEAIQFDLRRVSESVTGFDVPELEDVLAGRSRVCGD